MSQLCNPKASWRFCFVFSVVKMTHTNEEEEGNLIHDNEIVLSTAVNFAGESQIGKLC